MGAVAVAGGMGFPWALALTTRSSRHLGNCTTAPQSIGLISTCFRLTSAQGPPIINADEAGTREEARWKLTLYIDSPPSCATL